MCIEEKCTFSKNLVLHIVSIRGQKWILLAPCTAFPKGVSYASFIILHVAEIALKEIENYLLMQMRASFDLAYLGITANQSVQCPFLCEQSGNFFSSKQNCGLKGEL